MEPPQQGISPRIIANVRGKVKANLSENNNHGDTETQSKAYDNPESNGRKHFDVQ